MSTTAKPPNRNLKVVFDTNPLWTTSNTDLIRAEIRQLISENSSHPDLAVSWHIPEIVIEERKYQMLEATRALLPSLAKFEALFDVSVNTTPTALDERVSGVINRQLKELDVQRLAFNAQSVDWQEVMLSAAHRRPPFEAGKTEKGFKDQLVLESFCELVSNSPKSKTVCRLALVTGDDLLKSAVEQRMAHATNIRVFVDADELKSFIQTLVSTVDDEFIDEVAEKARLLFFVTDNKQTFYYKEDIGTVINAKFSGVFDEPPPGGLKPLRSKYILSNPNFIKKVGQRTHWDSRFLIEMKSTIPASAGTQPNALINALSKITSTASNPPGSTLTDLAQIDTSGQPVALYRTHRIDVHWSASLLQSRKLTKPKIESMGITSAQWTANPAE